MKLRNYSKFKVFVIFFIVIIIVLYLLIYFNTDFNYILMDNSTNILKLKDESKIYETSFISNLKVDEEQDVKMLSKTPLVYIYNTHQTEGYDYQKLEHSIKPTVFYASFILKEYLEDLGIMSIVETSSVQEYLNKNKLDYKGSYEATRYFIKEKLKTNKDIIYLIDIHRDSVTKKYTSYEKDNKNYARVLFVVSTKHDNYKENLKFVKSLNNKLESEYKGLTRGIYERKDVIFNQDLKDKAILLELGGVDSTLEEINNTLEVIAEIIYEDLANESK